MEEAAEVALGVVRGDAVGLPFTAVEALDPVGMDALDDCVSGVPEQAAKRTTAALAAALRSPLRDGLVRREREMELVMTFSLAAGAGVMAS